MPYKFSTSIGGFDFVTNGTSNISKVVSQELQKKRFNYSWWMTVCEIQLVWLNMTIPLNEAIMKELEESSYFEEDTDIQEWINQLMRIDIPRYCQPKYWKISTRDWQWYKFTELVLNCNWILDTVQSSIWTCSTLHLTCIVPGFESWKTSNGYTHVVRQIGKDIDWWYIDRFISILWAAAIMMVDIYTTASTSHEKLPSKESLMTSYGGFQMYSSMWRHRSF